MCRNGFLRKSRGRRQHDEGTKIYQQIQPLRIQKGTLSSTPGKMSAPPTQRPLAELGPMERRRNSPSYNQATKVIDSRTFETVRISLFMLLTDPQKDVLQDDASLFDSSPFVSDSPRLYWKKRDSGSPTRANIENRNPLDDTDIPHSVVKRSSIENLKRASRVKNSNMFAREHKGEYDPTSSPLVERPLAGGRPLISSVQGNTFGGRGLAGLRKEMNADKKRLTQNPLKSPANMRNMFEANASPSKSQGSPTKSSMSSKSQHAQGQPFDAESSTWTDDEESTLDRQLPPGKSLHRHAKSVTFDAAPPQINEYEMTTPDPSSLASGSRDGSHDSDEDDEEDESYDRGSSIERDDSFDASLEDTEKTPVVLPEDWRFMSPERAKDNLAAKVDDPFEMEGRSPSPTVAAFSAVDARLSPTRTDSAASDGERRPLPPLPCGISAGTPSKDRLNRSTFLEANARTPRKEVSPPRPASMSKAELQSLGGSSMPIEERLRLMMLQDQDNGDFISPVGQQSERAIRRSSSSRNLRNASSAGPEELKDSANLDDFEEMNSPPRISRESILRKIKGDVQPGARDSSLGSDAVDMAKFDPDEPLPTTELDDVDEDIRIKQEISGDESDLDVYSIPDLYSQHLQAESFLEAMDKLEQIEKKQATESQQDEDDGSHYSQESAVEQKQVSMSDETVEIDGPPTPRPNIGTSSLGQANSKVEQRMSLPQFAALLGEQDFGFGMESFMTPSPPIDQEPNKQPQAPRPEVLERPITPEEQLFTPAVPSREQNGAQESHTPDSVIRHPIDECSAPESPEIPAPAATIKSFGSKLKTRPSATPADIHAMAEARRQVSGEVPEVPKIPAKHFGRPSVVAEGDEAEVEIEAHNQVLGDESTEALRQTKRKSSLVALEVPVEGSDGLGIESEFDRLIEAQKVTPMLFKSTQFPTSMFDGGAEHMPGQGFRRFNEQLTDSFTCLQKGYLMRQNTKVIVASSASHESTTAESGEPQDTATRGTLSAGNSPRKPSQTKTWTTEPWNGRIRRKSIRQSGGIPSKSSVSGPVPPLPGQESSVSAPLDSVTENDATLDAEEVGEDGERGRLFVKVVRVKDLDLPLPRGMRYSAASTTFEADETQASALILRLP